jgi:hypothetical protein
MSAQRTLWDFDFVSGQLVAPPMSRNKWLALNALVEAGTNGLTDFELEARVGVKQTSIGKRRGDLVKAGLVEATGLFRPSDTGTASGVWCSTPAGYERWLVERGRRTG